MKNLILISLFLLCCTAVKSQTERIDYVLPFSEYYTSIEVENQDSVYVYQGDILLPKLTDTVPDVLSALAISGDRYRWPNSTMPYSFHNSVSPVMKTFINAAINTLNQSTNINLKPRTTEVDYVIFVETTVCNSHVGRQGGRQIINLTQGCLAPEIIHEIMHAIGFYHEQSRPDRDKYVDIFWNRIPKSERHNFDKKYNSITITPYNFSSIMHYGSDFFGINGQNTILKKDGSIINRPSQLSTWDIFAVNSIYPSVGCDNSNIILDGFGFNRGWRVEKHPRLLGDFNGDGVDDIVGFANYATYVSLFENSSYTDLELWVDAYSYTNHGWRVEKNPRLIGDFNGDGLDDIVGFANLSTVVSLSTGSSFTNAVTWVDAYSYNGGGWRIEKNPRLIGDFNGDGLDDIVGFANFRTVVSLSTGSSFTNPVTWVDGYSYDHFWRVEKNPRLIGDFNGDGLDDIVGFANETTVVSLSTGSSFTNAATWVDAYSYNGGGWRVEKNPRLVGDVNGDGLDDIVGFANFRTIVSLSTGSSFTNAATWTDGYSYDKGWRVDKHPRFLIDVNNDGMDDIVGFANRGIIVSFSTGQSFEDYKVVANTMGYVSGAWDSTKHPRIVSNKDNNGNVQIIGFHQCGVEAVFPTFHNNADLAAVFDNDLDGFLNTENDCNDYDSSINPAATDLPNNDLDEDCDGIYLCTNNSSCLCSIGNFQDVDNDGVCDVEDICIGFDDNLDEDNDSIPDACDECHNSRTQLGNASLSSGIYGAKDEIVSNALIYANEDVKFKAGNSIELQNDFEIKQGAIFEALIGNCE